MRSPSCALGRSSPSRAADAHFDSSLSGSQFVFTVSIYTVSTDGDVTRRTAFSTTALPTSLTAAALTGNGMDDLVAANALDNSVTVAIQTAGGQFAPPITLAAGIAPSDIAIADVNGDGLPDIIVSDQASGDVTVLLNDAAQDFKPVSPLSREYPTVRPRYELGRPDRELVRTIGQPGRGQFHRQWS